MNKEAVKSIFLTQCLLGILSAIGIAIVAAHQLPAFLAGFAVVTLQFYLLYVVWKRVFDKKPVALTVVLIITKYAVLGVLIYIMAKQGTSQLYGFLAGVTTLPACFVITALRVHLKKKG